jgi:hypothetical protein
MEAAQQMYLVIDSHTSIYSDPIKVGKGEQLFLSGRSDKWDGHQWLWAKAADGREGWVPDDLPAERGSQAYAAYPYSAVEFSVKKGDQLRVLEESHGWAWCSDTSASEGWVPLKVIEHC